MRLLPSGRIRWAAPIAIVMGLAAGGVAYASIPDGSGVIHGCYQKNVGNLRVIDSSTDSCRPSEVALNWSQTGPRGPTGTRGTNGTNGATGPTGPKGPAGSARDVGTVYPGATPIFFSEGLRGWVSVSSPSFGNYCLTPDPSVTVSNAALVLSPGSPGAGGLGFVGWEGYCSTSPVVFRVDTYDSSGFLSNSRPFTAVIP